MRTKDMTLGFLFSSSSKYPVPAVQQLQTSVHFSFVTLKKHTRFHTYSAECDKLVLPGVDGFIIGPISPHVSRAVDQPGGIQHQGVPQQSWDEVCYPERLPPQVPRHVHGDKEAHEQHGRLVIPVEETEWAERIELSVQK